VEEATEAENKAGLVPGSIWAFCPQKKGDHLGDYHKVFNGDNYIAWFCDQLIANLHQPSLIILDNAAYHCVYGRDVPKWHKLKKQECIDYLMVQSINFAPMMTAMEMKQLVKAYIINNVKIEVDPLAEKDGHTVLFTPAYHSDLQPIELVWALVKGNVGRQYSNQMTLEMVYDRLMHEFNQLEDSGHHSINGMIEKCTTLVWKFYGEMDAEDKIDEDNMEEDHDDSSVDIQDEAPEAPDAVIEALGDQGGIVEVKRRR
jgi:transposase